jgi:hypothetical protein
MNIDFFYRDILSLIDLDNTICIINHTMDSDEIQYIANNDILYPHCKLLVDKYIGSIIYINEDPIMRWVSEMMENINIIYILSDNDNWSNMNDVISIKHKIESEIYIPNSTYLRINGSDIILSGKIYQILDVFNINRTSELYVSVINI